jgi:hypothetical protein
MVSSGGQDVFDVLGVLGVLGVLRNSSSLSFSLPLPLRFPFPHPFSVSALQSACRGLLFYETKLAMIMQLLNATATIAPTLAASLSADVALPRIVIDRLSAVMAAQGTRYKIQDTRYKIQDTRYKIHDT